MGSNIGGREYAISCTPPVDLIRANFKPTYVKSIGDSSENPPTYRIM